MQAGAALLAGLRPAPEPPDEIPSDRSEFEYATIGALLIAGPATQVDILNAVDDSDFTDTRCQFLIMTARSMAGQKVPVDPVTVAAHVATHGLLGPGTPRLNLGAFMHETTEAAPVPASGTWYATGVVEAAVRRRVTSAATRIVDAAEAASVADLAEVIEAEFSSIRNALRRVTK